MEEEAIPTHHKPSTHLTTKKHGFLHVLRIVLYMIRRRSAKKSNGVDVASKGLWRRMVGSMRPLHTQHLPQTHSPQQINFTPLSPSVGSFHDVPPSPASSSCSDSTKSRYASATDLQALDKPDYESIEVVIEEGTYYDDEGDEMIDAKAEEFIANFYEQMKLQRLASIRYSERIRV